MKILHLFDDMMNLYGDYANVRVLERSLSQMGYSVTVDTLGAFETKDIGGYDLYYMGAGTERKQKLALEALRPYAQTLQEELEAGKLFLFTGNSLELLGKSLKDAEGKEHACLGFFDFETQEGSRRIVGDCLGKCSLFSRPVVGFMNKCSKTQGIRNPLFTLDMGFGNETQRGGEGILEKNFFGTHLTGPVLIKNPDLLKEILSRLTGKEGEIKDPVMERAYETTARELQKRLEGSKG